jgi:hypothetical protein
MPQPTFSQVHISQALTQIATAYIQDEANYVADKLFPVIPVQFQADKYFKYSKDDFFRDEAQLRADATESAGTGFNLTTGSYSAGVWALHKDLGDQTRRNADPALDLDVATTKEIMQKLLIRRERFFAANYVTSGVWGTDVTFSTAGVPGTTASQYWNDDVNGDPITDVLVGQTTIMQNTGFKPNKLLLTWPVYQVLRKHPLIIDRIKFTTQAFSGTVTAALLAQLFDVEEVLVSNAVYNSASEGQVNYTTGVSTVTGSYSFINGKNALLVYSPPSPGLMIPAAGYIFAWQGFTGLNSMGVRISQIPMPWLGMNTVRTEGEMAFDMQVIGNDLGYMFNGAVQ